MFTDSISGVASRLSRIYPTQLQLRLGFILLLAKFDLEEAISLFRSLEVPQSSSESLAQFEEASLFPYYDSAFRLADLCFQEKKPVLANLLIVYTIRTARTWEALGALHRVLSWRIQKSEMTEAMLNLYLENLHQAELKRAPEAQNWIDCIGLWRFLLQGELKTNKDRLWHAIETMFTAKGSTYTLSPTIIYYLGDERGPLKLEPYWPKRAKKVWDEAIVPLAQSEQDKERIKQLTDRMFSQADASTSSDIRQVTILHARPEARKLMDQAGELIRSRDKLQPIGAWEGKLASHLNSIRNFSEKTETDEERTLSFLEKHYAWLPAFAGYGQSPSKVLTSPEEIQEMLNFRPEHNLKLVILRDVLASLESEEGQWIYRYRRLFWIGFLKLYIEEIRTHQPHLLEEFQKMAGASSSDIIRYMATAL
jgi:hypothetical protein